MSGNLPRELVVRAGASIHRVRVVSEDAVEIEGRRIAVSVSPMEEPTLVVVAGGARHAVHVAVDGERAWAMSAGEAFVIEPAATESAAGKPADGGPDACIASSGAGSGVGSGAGSGTASVGGDLSAPMPATVTAVLVRPGDRVSAGDPVVRLEAMKMELVVAAPRAGRIATVDCREGDLVQPGRSLATLEEGADS